MNKALFFDIESNGLLMDATNIWCLCGILGEEKITATGEIVGKSALESADILIGHNIIMYDLPVIKKIWGWSPRSDQIIIDTIILSRLLNSDQFGGHSLKAWGTLLGIPKGEFTDFSKLSNEMIEYCHRDVEVTKKVYEKLISNSNFSACKEALQIEQDFAKIIVQQVTAGFKLDVPAAEKLYIELTKESDLLTAEVLKFLPSLRNDAHYKSIVKKGLLLAETPTSYTYTMRNKVVTKEFKFTQANPTSRKQLIDYFTSKGWKPKEFSDKNNPKIGENILKFIPFPEAKVLSKLFKVQKQMSMIKNEKGGWLNFVKEDGRVHGDVITNGAIGGRCLHAKPNISQADKRMRQVWVAEEGKVLVGVDAASLEIRILAHYIAKYDKGLLAFECVQGDIHTHNMNIMGFKGSKDTKANRDAAKRALYALIYGAGDAKLGTIVAENKSVKLGFVGLKAEGTELRNKVKESLTGYKEIWEDIRKALSRGFVYGLDKRPLYPRKDYSALNLIIQSAGAIVMKKALINFDKEASQVYNYKYVANIHDEIIIECNEEDAERLKKLLIQAIQKTTEDFKLKCPMDGEGKIGKSWAETK